jgi:hypothetical protein
MHWFLQNPHHNIVEEQSSKNGRCLSEGSEEAASVLESERFRKYAADCMRIARQMNGQDRRALLEIAEAWEARARDAEKKEKAGRP